jgi:hypothetical protein
MFMTYSTSCCLVTNLWIFGMYVCKKWMFANFVACMCSHTYFFLHKMQFWNSLWDGNLKQCIKKSISIKIFTVMANFPPGGGDAVISGKRTCCLMHRILLLSQNFRIPTKRRKKKKTETILNYLPNIISDTFKTCIISSTKTGKI